MNSPPDFKSVHDSLDPEIIGRIKDHIEWISTNLMLPEAAVSIDTACWNLEIEVFNKTVAACQRFILESLKNHSVGDDTKKEDDAP